MTRITIIDEETRTIEATVDRARRSFLIEPDRLPDALGWTLTPSGLCRPDRCVPVGDRGTIQVGERLDLMAVAGVLGRPALADLDVAVVAVALPAELRREALLGLRAPPFALPDLAGQRHGLDEWRGLKKLLVTFSSWCGCRYDLPGWQALHDELAPEGFTVIAVALDTTAEDVAPWCEGITMPLLYDPAHLLTELYAISNVPTVVWIDEDDRIVRPNASAFGSDLFADFTGVSSAPHLDSVRRWVGQGVVPLTADQAREAVADLSEQEVLARLHFRVAVEAHRQGNPAVTRRHVEAASALAPDDLTIWRAGMPLVGVDPFGDEFLAHYEEWKQRGMPYHGLPPMSASQPAS